jgi:hypothetical protein
MFFFPSQIHNNGIGMSQNKGPPNNMTLNGRINNDKMPSQLQLQQQQQQQQQHNGRNPQVSKFPRTVS